MFIIINNECIDTSIFQEFRFYENSGVIAFIYRNPNDKEKVELPVTFDDAFQAELTFDEIVNSYESSEKTYVSDFNASVPSGLLAKMKRGFHIPTKPFKDYAFNDKQESNVLP